MELILSSVFRRHYNNLPVHWLPLYAPVDLPYGTRFEIAPEFDLQSKNIPPDGMFLTSRGMLGADYGYLMKMGLDRQTFRNRALPLLKRTKPLHIVFNGILWFIRFEFPFASSLSFERKFWERDWGIIELQFAVTGSRFDYTPADARYLDTQSLKSIQEIEDSFSLNFLPDYHFWHLDHYLLEGLPLHWLPTDTLLCGNESDKNPVFLIPIKEAFPLIRYNSPEIRLLLPDNDFTLTDFQTAAFFMEEPMEETSTRVWQQAKLLNRYYEKVGKAAAGQGACPQFTEFAAGYGLVDESDPANPVLLPIPADMTEIPNEFYRGIIEATFNNDTTLCKCEIPQTAVGSPVRHNLISIFDQDNELVAVCQTLPDWVTPSERYRAFPAITFPMEKENAND